MVRVRGGQGMEETAIEGKIPALVAEKMVEANGSGSAPFIALGKLPIL